MSATNVEKPQTNASVDKLRNRIGLLRSQLSANALTGEDKKNAEQRLAKDERILKSLLQENTAVQPSATNDAAAQQVKDLQEQVGHLTQQVSVLKEGIIARDSRIEELTALLVTETEGASAE